MSARWMRLLLCLVFLVPAGGCSLGAGNAGSSNGGNGIALSVLVGEREMAGSSARLLNEAYVDGITVMELFKKSGVAEFSADGRLTEVNKILLSPGMVWNIEVNGKKPQSLDSALDPGASIVISVDPGTGGTALQPVIIMVNGGSEQPELTHCRVLPFTEDLSVKLLMKNSGMVQLAEDNRTLLNVMEYTPLSNEEWRLKVNDKALLGNGVDMKLKPLDLLEIALVLRNS